MKYIFLDIDGVLNIISGANNTYMKTGKHMEVDLIELFNDFLDEYPNIKLIISSDWRQDLPDLQECLEDVDFKHWNKVIGATGYSDWRGNEIQDYINDNLTDKDQYCVLDDNMYFICGNSCSVIDKKYCVQSNPKTGIDKLDLVNILRILSL